MKISEETNDGDMKEQAKVNFGMANASLKWNNHITGILQQIEDQNDEADAADNEDADKVGKVDEVAPEDEDDA
jgi:hypothetical protein